MTFLAGHTPLVGTIKPGVVRVVRPEEDEERVASHGGFVQVETRPRPADDGSSPAGGTRVTLLFGVAELAEEIDVARAEAARQAAEARLSELGGPGGHGSGVPGRTARRPDPEVAEAEATLLRAQVRLEAVDAASGAQPPPPA